MHMTEIDIKNRYSFMDESKDRVKILSELNNCPMIKIAQILGIPYKKKPKQIKRAVSYKKVTELYEQGYSDTEIAETINCYASSVCVWRKTNNLKMNRKKRRIK